MTPTKMGAISQTWCDYFYEARDSALERMKDNGLKVGNFLVQMQRHGETFPAHMIQLFTADSLGIDADTALHYQNPISSPLVVVGDSTKEPIASICQQLEQELKQCESADSFVTALYFWQYKCMLGLLRMGSLMFPTSDFESWQKCKEFHDPANWDCYCDRFANLRCIVRTVAGFIALRPTVAPKIGGKTSHDQDDSEDEGEESSEEEDKVEDEEEDDDKESSKDEEDNKSTEKENQQVKKPVTFADFTDADVGL